MTDAWTGNGDVSAANRGAADDPTAQFLRPFSRVGAERARAILNVLVESSFFYQQDDPDLFATLRRHARVFQTFFEATFGWDLVIDPFVAKLNKPTVYNRALTARQRHVFQLTARGEYVLFILLLEFQELQAEQQNVDLSSEAELRFLLRDYIEFIFQRFRDDLGQTAPSEEAILGWARTLFDKLVLHRFLALRERSGRAESDGIAAAFSRDDGTAALYAMLPGLRCYRPEALALDLLRPDLTRGDSPEETPPSDGATDGEEEMSPGPDPEGGQ